MFTSGFFNSVNSDRKYNAEQMSAIFDGIIRDGIFDSVGDHFAVTPGTGLAVSVGTGRAWLNSTWSYNDTAYPIALSAASASLSRIDLICIKVDKSSNVRANSIVCIEGTPASYPVEPTITDDTTNEIYYHKLAAVSVAAGATSISAADITNYVGLAAGTPYVTGILSSTTVDELWSQWDGEFNDWWDDIKATLDDNIVTTILNKIDHITPKESTMNLYGFSHINPPPAGKTYQEYSTDAILNQINNLFLSYGVLFVRLHVYVDNEPSCAGIPVTGFTTIDGTAVEKETDENGMVYGIMPNNTATYTTHNYSDMAAGSITYTKDGTEGQNIDLSIYLESGVSGQTIVTESGEYSFDDDEFNFSPYLRKIDLSLVGSGTDGETTRAYKTGDTSTSGTSGGEGGSVTDVYDIDITKSYIFTIGESGSNAATTVSDSDGNVIGTANSGGNGSAGRGGTNNPYTSGINGGDATQYPFGDSSNAVGGGGGGGGACYYWEGGGNPDTLISPTNGGSPNGGNGGGNGSGGGAGTFPGGGGGGANRVLRQYNWSATFYGGKGGAGCVYVRWNYVT